MTSAPGIGFDYRPSRWPQALLLTLGRAGAGARMASAAVPVLALVASVMIIHYVWSSLRRIRHVPRAIGHLASRRRLEPACLHDDETVEARLAGSARAGRHHLLRLAWDPRRRGVC